MNQVTDYYLRVQALTPVTPVSPVPTPPTVMGSTGIASLFANPLPISIVIFLVLTGIGFIGLVFTKTKDVNKILTLLILTLMTSAIPFGLQMTSQKTRIESQAGPSQTPKNVIVNQVEASGFVVIWETDTETTGTIRLRTTKEPGASQQVFSEGEGVKTYKHAITLTKLKAGTNYYLEILSGSEWYNLNGEPIRVKTLAN